MSKKCLLDIRIQWNAGTACVSECVLQMLACRGLRVGPSKQCVVDGCQLSEIPVPLVARLFDFLASSAPLQPLQSDLKPSLA